MEKSHFRWTIFRGAGQPHDLIDRYSDNIVLTEEALSDQIIGFGLGEYAALLDYFSKTPCLFLGFSLEDQALRTLLRHTVRRSPGVVHYYVRYVRNDELSEEQMQQIRETNFDLFNVVTLFLTNEELHALLELMAILPEDNFHDAFVTSGCLDRYLYYIAGPVSIGKTSVISRLRGVDVVDEWLTPRKPEIAKPSHELTDEERRDIDLWIMDQIRLKNSVFKRSKCGISVMDRAPLDAFAFTPAAEQKAKADSIWKVACVGGPHGVSLESGTVLLLKGRGDDLEMRQRWRGRSGDKAYVEEQQKELIRTYCVGDNRAYEIDTTGQSLDVVVRRVLKVLHLCNYKEFDFNSRLNDYRAGAVSK